MGYNRLDSKFQVILYLSISVLEKFCVIFAVLKLYSDFSAGVRNNKYFSSSWVFGCTLKLDIYPHLFQPIKHPGD